MDENIVRCSLMYYSKIISYLFASYPSDCVCHLFGIRFAWFEIRGSEADRNLTTSKLPHSPYLHCGDGGVLCGFRCRCRCRCIVCLDYCTLSKISVVRG